MDSTVFLINCIQNGHAWTSKTRRVVCRLHKMHSYSDLPNIEVVWSSSIAKCILCSNSCYLIVTGTWFLLILTCNSDFSDTTKRCVVCTPLSIWSICQWNSTIVVIASSIIREQWVGIVTCVYILLCTYSYTQKGFSKKEEQQR